MRRSIRPARPALCEPLDRRLLLSAAVPTTYGVYPLAPSAGLQGILNISSATTDGTVYFTAVDADGAPALWRTDGSPEGTTAIAPLPAPFDAYRAFSDEAVFGDNELFADVGGYGHFLVSDGTAASTTAVPFGGSIANAAGVGNTVFFGGLTVVTINGGDVERWGLWRTDGTVDGTVRLATVEPIGMTAVGNRLFFFSSDDAGLHLWTSDGTVQGTVQLATVNPNPKPGVPQADQMVALGGELYFVNADPADLAGDLWRSDGTAAGTTQLTGSLAFANTAAPAQPARLFSTGNRLVYDQATQFVGIDPGTGTVTTLMPSKVGEYETYQSGPNVAGPSASGEVVFQPVFIDTGDRGSPAPAEWWTTDGTPSGTVPIGAELSTSNTPAGSYDPSTAQTVPFGNGLFVATHPAPSGEGYTPPASSPTSMR
jgi:ELWxxDGT repeat protein